MKSRYQRDIYTSMVIVALFTAAKMWKQTKHPLMYEWISV